jgi:hypothetical protein
MLRKVLGVAVLFVFVGTLSVQAAAKADAVKTGGQFKSYKDGTLTITAKKKGEDAKDVDFKVESTFKVKIIDGDNTKDSTAGDAFKDLKAGTRVVVTKEGDKITDIVVGNKKK